MARRSEQALHTNMARLEPEALVEPPCIAASFVGRELNDLRASRTRLGHQMIDQNVADATTSHR